MSLIGFAIERIFPPPPTEFEYPEIGRLEQDPHRPSCYAGAVDWPVGAVNGGQITLVLHGDKPTRGGLKNAAQYFLAMRAAAQCVTSKAADCAGEYLYPKWRDEWFGDDEEIPLDAWTAALKIERIWVDPLGHIGIDYRYGDPFAGHHATVSGIAPDRFDYASLSV